MSGSVPSPRRAVWSARAAPALVLAIKLVAVLIFASAPLAARAATPETIAVPEDAVLPEPGSSRLRAVGPGKRAKVGLTYGALASAFHDGTRVTAADLLYPYALAYRWSGGDGDPAIDKATALLRERLVGVRPAGVDRTSKSIRFGDLELVREMLIFEVYLNESGDGLGQAAALAPPSGSVPWHVLALMEAAVVRGWAAFSEQRAARLGVEWLDLARSAPLKQRLAALVDAFERQGYVPEPLQGMVTAEAARARWRALRAFAEKHGHYLVTAGPYLLKSWSAEATVLQVFRDISYPLGVGSYDAYAIPRRAYISGIETQERGLRIAVEVEKVEKFSRSYEIVRQPLRSAKSTALAGQTLDCRYLVVAADGMVRLAGRGRLQEDGSFAIDLAAGLAPGQYTVVTTVTLTGNTVRPDIRQVPFRVPE